MVAPLGSGSKRRSRGARGYAAPKHATRRCRGTNIGRREPPLAEGAKGLSGPAAAGGGGVGQRAR